MRSHLPHVRVDSTRASPTRRPGTSSHPEITLHRSLCHRDPVALVSRPTLHRLLDRRRVLGPDPGTCEHARTWRCEWWWSWCMIVSVRCKAPFRGSFRRAGSWERKHRFNGVLCSAGKCMQGPALSCRRRRRLRRPRRYAGRHARTVLTLLYDSSPHPHLSLCAPRLPKHVQESEYGSVETV